MKIVPPMREIWIDSWKGILIFLVVFGHVVGTAANLTTGRTSEFYSFLFKNIYLFHMPAFFFLAGWVWQSPVAGAGAFVRRKFFRLMIPFFFWGSLSAFIFYVATNVGNFTNEGYCVTVNGGGLWKAFGSIVCAASWPGTDGFRSNTVLWFLPTMFSTLLVYWVIDRHVDRWLIRSLIAAGCLAYALPSFPVRLPVLPLSVGAVPTYLPYLIAGHGLAHAARHFYGGGGCGSLRGGERGGMFAGFEGRGMRWLGVLSLTGVYCCLSRFVDYGSVGWLTVSGRLKMMGMALFGCLLSVCWARLASGRLWAVWGQHSLAIMLVHKFLIVALMLLWPFMRGVFASVPLPANVLLAFALSLVVLLASYGIGRLVVRYLPWSLGVKKFSSAI